MLKREMNSSIGGSESIKSLHSKRGLSLLPDKELEWLDRNNLRLLRWVKFYWLRRSSFSPIPAIDDSPISEPGFYNYFIESLDYWKVDLSQKRSELNTIKAQWSQKQLEDRQLNWLDNENNNQVNWAWNYLNEKAPFYVKLAEYSPINAEEMYVDILSIFDTWPGDTGSLYKLQTSMKQAWSQQKYRANLQNEKKKQSTYVLGTDTKSQLQKLVKKNNVNLNQMLEYIIDQAYKNSKKGKFDE